MIVRNIHKKANRTKADSTYMLLSTSDIGVGVLSMLGLHWGFVVLFGIR